MMNKQTPHLNISERMKCMESKIKSAINWKTPTFRASALKLKYIAAIRGQSDKKAAVASRENA